MPLKSKKEAAQLLGVSTRAIERAVRRGHLTAQYRPAKHGAMAWFAAEDLSRYQKLQKERTPVGFSSGLPQAPKPRALTLGAITTSDEHGAQRPAGASNLVPLNERLALSLEEAIQLSGLPREFLLTNIRSQKLKSLKISGAVFVKRADLKAFVRKL